MTIRLINDAETHIVLNTVFGFSIVASKKNDKMLGR